MDSQQQQQAQTEKLIENMLDFLETSSEEEDDCGKFSINGKQDEHATANDNEFEDEATKDSDKTNKENETLKGTSKKVTKINQQFPVWNTREIVPSNTRSVSLPQSPTGIDETLWRQSSLSILSKSQELFERDVNQNLCNESHDNGYTNLEKNCRLSSNNAYVQEVYRAIYGDTRGHPATGSAEYNQAAQNYAIYGKEFLDFPQDIRSIMSVDVPAAGDKGTVGIGGYPLSIQPPGVMAGCHEVFSHASVNSFGKSSTSTSAPMGTTSTSASVAAVAASAAAYYQLCNGLQSQVRSTAATYGMFVGNKMTYVAAVPSSTPQLVYNQHTSQATTNFISNSLANAALAASPAILYSNPMLTNTTQQYINAFFKDTQYAGGVNSTQANTNGVYDRLIYAQMLQQQLYHQSQQAAAVAAMYQHKQRANIAARLATNGTTLNGNGGPQTASSAQPSPPPVGGGSPTSISTPGIVNHCGRQAAMTSDISLIKQQCPIPTIQNAITVNGGDEISRVSKA